jgi:predicted nucleotidyltransferase
VNAEQTQIQEAIAALSDIFADALLAVYLHGSAAQSSLRPQSDLDLLAVIARPMTDEERADLLALLLSISGRHPRRAGQPRCLEVIVFVAIGEGLRSHPAEAEFVYGEWLRSAFERGEIPGRTSHPENTLVLAQARQNAVALVGPSASTLLPEFGAEVVRCAMRDALPGLMDGLEGDERNVLLTLARMWRTFELGDFMSKEAAAAWAAPQVPDQQREVLDYARKAYLGELSDSWIHQRHIARMTAEHLHERISAY